MKHVRTTITGALAAVLAVAAIGCGDDSKPAAGAAGNKGKSLNLAFVQGVELGATVKTQGPQKFDATLQTPIVQGVVASKPDALIIAPTDVSAMQAPIQQAVDRGIKVVLVDTTLKDPSVAVSAIASDNIGGGKAAFDAIKKIAPGGGKVLVIDNQPGISTSQARTDGFDQAVKTDPSYVNIGVQYVANDTAKAAQIVNSALQKDPDIVAIFATNIFGAQGAATGVRQAGKQGKVKIVGFDAGPEQVKALQDGTIQALIAQQPGTIGAEGVKQAVAALKGETSKQEIQTGFTILTQENLDSPEGQAALYKAGC
jgi:ribose transport system substrate-binding protein